MQTQDKSETLTIDTRDAINIWVGSIVAVLVEFVFLSIFGHVFVLFDRSIMCLLEFERHRYDDKRLKC